MCIELLVCIQCSSSISHAGDLEVSKEKCASVHLHIEERKLIAQSCLILCEPMDCGPPGSSVPGVLQARILEWVAISFLVDLSHPGIKPGSPSSIPGLGRSTGEGIGCPLQYSWASLMA